nr:hypothetical protein [Bacteroides fragilis]
MKQTTEEAAYDYATEKTKFRKDVLKEVDAGNYVSRHADCMEDFQCGYNYCKEQSLWISIEDRLPDNDDNVFYFILREDALSIMALKKIVILLRQVSMLPLSCFMMKSLLLSQRPSGNLPVCSTRTERRYTRVIYFL